MNSNLALNYDNYPDGQEIVIVKKYDLITFHVPVGMEDEIRKRAEEKTGLAFSTYVRRLIEKDLGIEFGMKEQKADNTGVRHKGKK